MFGNSVRRQVVFGLQEDASRIAGMLLGLGLSGQRNSNLAKCRVLRQGFTAEKNGLG